MRMGLDCTRIAHTAFSAAMRGRVCDWGALVPPAAYSLARHIRTPAFL